MRIVIFYLFVFFTLLTYSQEEKHNLTKDDYLILQDKARSYQYTNIDSSFFYLNKIEKSSNYTHKAFANAMRGYLYQLTNDSIKSKKSTLISYQYLNKVSNSEEKTRLKAYLLNFEGLCYWERFQIKKALEKYNQGKKLAKKINDVPQIIKFNSNIALVIGEMGNLNSEIKTLKSSLDFIKNNEYLFPQNEYLPMISNTYLTICNSYVRKFKETNEDKKVLDSAIVFCKKAIHHAEEKSYLKLNTLLTLGDIYVLKNDLEKAKKIYLSANVIAKESNFLVTSILISNKIGKLFYTEEKLKEALLFFNKADSIYKINRPKNEYFNEYLEANYYLTKLYYKLGDRNKVILHSEIYLKNYLTKNKENKFLSDDETLKNEVENLKKETVFEKRIQIVSYIALVVLLLVLVFFVIKNRKESVQQNQEIKAIVSENKTTIQEIQKLEQLSVNKKEKTKTLLKIDTKKEETLLKKLKQLEKEQLFLSKDFTQRLAAKIIKTNTTYLSFIVNKHFQKTFGEYTNDLKIDYVVKEMKSNATYRKYTTQAIAESAGFKSAISFRKSFKNKIGKTPIEFIKDLNNL
ncbi:AraC family transcriptional regulator [Flavobacterium jejuense]|uniref:AraC family transcriptional regulator n=1 Tax=Flavobacterium jejuense TaxID=1544455 RepID=A0ABX0IQN5_9FLAO|nr:helix-turn-helix domain-containing protein [Flavobacterium jejuense]NHN26018.1 AraC family transcriptional regulator [Flavobacterium jejuense]